MNYSRTIREYCLQNSGMMFDMSYEHKKHFGMVPYRTFCKILSRLEDEEILNNVFEIFKEKFKDEFNFID